MEVYAIRRLMAAQHAAELMGCLDRLETRMEDAPGDRIWLERLQAAAAGRQMPGEVT